MGPKWLAALPPTRCLRSPGGPWTVARAAARRKPRRMRFWRRTGPPVDERPSNREPAGSSRADRRSLTLRDRPVKVGPLFTRRKPARLPQLEAPGMKCPRCNQDNPIHARFCLGCGAHLVLACGSCGAELPGGARFCLQCGQAVAAGTTAPVRSPAPETYTPKHLAEKIITSKAALEGERKQVTVLFADLKGSMELLADRDPEEARKILDP